MRSRLDLAQALLEGASTAAWIAVPDYAATKGRRRTAKAVILAATVAGVVVTESLRPEEPSPEDQPPEEAVPASPGRRSLVVSAALLAASSPFLFNRGVDRGAAWLHRRGVQRPRTVIGLAAGTVTALGSLTTDR